MSSRRTDCSIALAFLVGVSAAAQDVSLPRYVDVSTASGIDFVSAPSATSQKYLPETMLGGAAMLDYDSDGLLDLFFVNGARLEDPMREGAAPDKSDPQYWNRLYRNEGHCKFRDVTVEVGLQGSFYGQGAAVGDFDNDGRPDLFVTGLSRNALYRNVGDGTFVDVTDRAGVGGSGWSTSAAFLDYDNDGRLDLVVLRYLDWSFAKNRWCGDRDSGRRSYCHPDQFQPATPLLYRNQGDGTFADVSKGVGFANASGKGLGVTFNDFDGDGRLDIFIANDSWPQQLFRNRGEGGFEERGLSAGVAYDEDGREFAGMGTDFQDYDNDGRPDIFVNALARQGYHLFRNAGDSFEDASRVTGVSGVTGLSSGWGAAFVDFDNDGWKDIFVAQGHVMDNIEVTQPGLRYREPLLMLRNNKGKFEDVSARLGNSFQTPLASRGAIAGDLDNDGSVDLVVYRNGAAPMVLRNGGANGAHWLTVDLEGVESNRDAIGATLHLVAADGGEQWTTVNTSGGYLSARDGRAHLGLGANARVKVLEIRWPSRKLQRLENVAADQVLMVREANQ